LRVGFQQCAARNFVAMAGDVPGIGPFDHFDACVVQRRHDSDRHVGEQLAHDAAVPQRIERHFISIEPGCLDHRAEIIAVMAAAAVSPPLAVAAQE